MTDVADAIMNLARALAAAGSGGEGFELRLPPRAYAAFDAQEAGRMIYRDPINAYSSLYRLHSPVGAVVIRYDAQLGGRDCAYCGRLAAAGKRCTNCGAP